MLIEYNFERQTKDKASRKVFSPCYCLAKSSGTERDRVGDRIVLGVNLWFSNFFGHVGGQVINRGIKQHQRASADNSDPGFSSRKASPTS